MGADPLTFAGLAGLGDLVATCSSPLSRNRTFGTNLGTGMTLQETIAVTRQTAEGVKSCESVLDLARRHGVDMPITETVVGIVHEGKPPVVAVRELMSRSAQARTTLSEPGWAGRCLTRPVPPGTLNADMSTENLPQSPRAAARKPRVAVVFGGRSSEHGISVVTAGAVLRAIDRTKYDVLPIGITRDGRWVLTADEPERMAIADRRRPTWSELAESSEGGVVLSVDPANREVVYSEPGSVPKALGEVDVVFPVLHGPYGEDGTLQGLLELSGVPYVGAGVLASAVGMDKEYMKRVFTSFGLAVGPYVVIRPREWEQRRAAPPARRSSTSPVSTAGRCSSSPRAPAPPSASPRSTTSPDSTTAIEEARAHDPKVLVEALLRGREIECGVLEFEDGPRASVPAEIPPRRTRTRSTTSRPSTSTPARRARARPAHREQTAEVQRLAVEAFEAASCEGLARVDFFLTEDGEFVINEINTMPGFTPISMYPRMWQASGVGYPELVDRLIQAALRRSDRAALTRAPGLRSRAHAPARTCVRRRRSLRGSPS